MNVKWKRRISWLVIGGITALALAYGFREQPRPVDIASVTRDTLQVTIEEEGRTRVKDRYLISAPVAGTTCRIDLDVGDRVEKGQVLANISPLQSQALDPRSHAKARAGVAAAQSALHAAEERVESARAESSLAASDLERLRPLAEEGHISMGKLDEARARARSSAAALRSSKFDVEVARHELEAAETALQYTGTPESDPAELVHVRAPVHGSVLKVMQECEIVVDAGQPLLEIGNTASLEIETDVLSADAVRIRPGMPVVYERWGGGAPLAGSVRRVEPVGFTKVSALGVEEQRVLVISDITSEPQQWESLGDGYRVESRFILWEEPDVLQVPASALFRVDDDWALFVVQDDIARRRAVSIGQHNGLSAQVLEGLEENERVITHPDDAIRDGSRVKRR